MSDVKIWLIYAGITAVLALLTYGIKDKTKGLLKTTQSVASVLFVLVGITFVVVTAVLVLDRVAPNLGEGGDSSDEETCIPDPWGGC